MKQDFSNPSASAHRLLTEQELAQELGLHINTLATWRREGVHPRPRHLQIGKAIRYTRESVNAFLAACAAAPQNEQPSTADLAA